MIVLVPLLDFPRMRSSKHEFTEYEPLRFHDFSVDAHLTKKCIGVFLP